MRTQGEQRRRRSIANAAAGRTAVVLYACTEQFSGPAWHVFTDLRRYAAARDWQVAREILDAAPLSTPLDERPEWCKVRDLILDGSAEGIVAPETHARDDVPSEHSALSEWLAEHAAFLSLAPRPSGDLRPQMVALPPMDLSANNSHTDRSHYDQC